jgi:hypothetical protein
VDYADWGNLVKSQGCCHFVTIPLECVEGMVGAITVASDGEPPSFTGVAWLAVLMGQSMGQRKLTKDAEVRPRNVSLWNITDYNRDNQSTSDKDLLLCKYICQIGGLMGHVGMDSMRPTHAHHLHALHRRYDVMRLAAHLCIPVVRSGAGANHMAEHRHNAF